MSNIKKSDSLDLKAVAVNPVGANRPGDDDPCQPFWNWCLKMDSVALKYLDKINPADLAVLTRLGILKDYTIPKETLAAAGAVARATRPADDDRCPAFWNWCIKMGSLALDWLNKVNPADLEVLTRLGIVNESVLTNAQKVTIKDIRK